MKNNNPFELLHLVSDENLGTFSEEYCRANFSDYLKKGKFINVLKWMRSDTGASLKVVLACCKFMRGHKLDCVVSNGNLNHRILKEEKPAKYHGLDRDDYFHFFGMGYENFGTQNAFSLENAAEYKAFTDGWDMAAKHSGKKVLAF